MEKGGKQRKRGWEKVNEQREGEFGKRDQQGGFGERDEQRGGFGKGGEQWAGCRKRASGARGAK